MLIGLIGDVHQENLALGWALAELQDRDVDLIVCTGDIADGYGDLNACCELLESHGVVTVRGNHDRWLLAEQMRDLPQAAALASANPASQQWLSELPVTQSLDTPAGQVLLCHGLGSDDMARVRPEDTQDELLFNEPLQQLLREGRFSIVICGHTHQPMQRGLGELTIVNAGTLHRSYAPTVGVLDVPSRRTEFFPLPDLFRGS